MELEDFAASHLVPLPDLGDSDQEPGGKRGKIENTYQKKTQLEHILLRPDSYIGSVEPAQETMWVFDSESGCMVQREITFVPGLYKIFDEILVNAADNKQRDAGMSCIRVDIKPEENVIKIWNNGKGIPVVEHKEEKMLVPTLIFGHLLTSSNFNDSEKRVTGGRNGYGAKLCNVFSTEFSLETSCRQYRKRFKQTWRENMTKAMEAKVSEASAEDYTCITFKPDLRKFKMQRLTQDMVDLFTRRAYDIAATCPGVRVYLNGKKLGIKTFKDYVDLYVKNKTDDAGNALKVVYEQVNPRWEVAVALSTDGFKQISFVNSIATTKGGRHVDYLSEQIVKQLVEVVKKKQGKGGVQIKPSNLKNHLWIFCRCLIENPSFDSQTKEYMSSQQKLFGSKCELSQKFVEKVGKCGIVESIMNWVKLKAMQNLDKQCYKAKHSKLKGIAKLDDANLAGTKQSHECVLILTEGDSAKSLAVAGLGVVGRDRYGVFPLRGKLLNVREANFQQVVDNSEISNLVKILGLQYNKKYREPEELRSLRYGKVMIMADQDQDGSHIKGLLINFLHFKWPELLKHDFIEEFITPIVKVFKGKQVLSFFSLPEFEEWRNETPDWHTWRVKYYKGLGTSSSQEAKEYFNDMTRHRIKFRYKGEEDDEALKLAFGKSADSRKEWLTGWMEERRRRQDLGLQEGYLYEKGTRAVTYSDFVNKELILFSNMDNERSIPSLIDGLKPGQRKVLFTCFKRNLVKEIKVAQLAGSVSELSAYHHGEASLMGTIVGLAQDFCGSNNLNLLLPHGQFGTRLHGGKDAASARYIFTSLSPIARLVFNPHDEPMLDFQSDDNLKIEPKWYIPVLPMVLVNGADGIGTGWSTRIPNFGVADIVANIRRMIAGQEPTPMLPSYRGFRGHIEEVGSNKYVIFGEIGVLDDTTVEITELPVKTWTQSYKESVLEPMLNGTDKQPAVIQDYKEYHTDTTVKFVVKMAADRLRAAEEAGLHKFFKLQTTLTVSSMILFDQNDCIKKYNSVYEILREYFKLRLEWYEKRKLFLLGKLAAESLKLENQARFIVEKTDGKLSIENLPRQQCERLLHERGYEPDPLKAWKASVAFLTSLLEDEAPPSPAESRDYDYLLSMPILSLTKEKKEELVRLSDEKAAELRALRGKSPQEMWSADLDQLQAAMSKMERDIAERLEEQQRKLAAKQLGGKGRAAKVKKPEFQPSAEARRVAPEVSDSLKAKLDAEKKRRPREPKAAAENGAGKAFEFADSDSDAEPKPLLQRLTDSGVDVGGMAPGASTVAKRPRPEAADDSDDASDFEPPSASTPATTKKKQSAKSPKSKPAAAKRRPSPSKAARQRKPAAKKPRPWERDSGDSSDSGGGPSDGESPATATATSTATPGAERRPSRGSKAAAKYVFSDSSGLSDVD